MRLNVTSSNELFSADFTSWLLDCIQTRLISQVSSSKFAKWTTYFQELETDFQNITRFDATSIVLEGIKSLEIVQSGAYEFIIQINPHKKLLRSNQMTVSQACKMINFGNLSVKGVPIFSKVFQETVDDLDKYIMRYYELEGELL